MCICVLLLQTRAWCGASKRFYSIPRSLSSHPYSQQLCCWPFQYDIRYIFFSSDLFFFDEVGFSRIFVFCCFFFHSALFLYLEMAKFYERPFLSIAVFIFSANLRSLLGFLVDLDPSCPHCLKITCGTQNTVKSRRTTLPRQQKKERW